MGIMQIFGPEVFYIKTDPKSFKNGQICWIVSPYIKEIPQILDVERNKAEEHDEFKFDLKNVDPDNDFKPSAKRTLPIKYLNLESTEELLIQKAKKRPAIIISSGLDAYPEIAKLLKQRGKIHLQEDSLFLIPCYGVETQDDRRGFPSEMVTRIRCLLYRQFFYMPYHSPLTSESIARLDRIQVIVGRHRAAIEPTSLCLSDDVFYILLAQFMFCISGIEEEEFAIIRSLVKETYIPSNSDSTP
jgi:hypothetical protein